MRDLVVPAGAAVRFAATARADNGLHRWAIAVLPVTGGAARLNFGSRIGGRDVEQRVDIPAQDVDCRLAIESRHETPHGWAQDRASPDQETSDRLLIGFCDPSGARRDDVLLSFAVGPSDRQRQKGEADGQRPETIESRSAQAQAAEGEAASAGPHLS